MDSCIAFKKVRVLFRGETVLEVPELSVPTQKLIAVVGPNGAAKTTFLRAMLGKLKCSGHVSMPAVLRKKNAYMAQNAVERKDFPLTVSEYISASLYGEYGVLKKVDEQGKERVDEALERVALKGFAQRLLKGLSGGEWQRVQLARLLLLDAYCYVLDEPFSAVDRNMVVILQKRLQELCDQGKTVFVVTHDLVAVQKFFDYAILLRGEVVAAGLPKDVLTAQNIEKAYGWLVDGSF